MQIYIDQSGRVEYTSHPTVVAYSNHKNRAVIISASEKRKLKQVFREAGKPDIFAIKIFAILIFLSIEKDLPKISSIIIDEEYTGKRPLIKKYLLETIRKKGLDFNPHNISFLEIGKKAGAHKKAIAVFRGDDKAEIKVTSLEIVKWLI